MPEALADSGKTRTAAIRCLMSRRLAGLLARQRFPRYRAAFGYGSAVIPQRSTAAPALVDAVLCVDDARAWHAANVLRNPAHYSWLKTLGPAAIATAQATYPGVYYNVTSELKYGVVATADLHRDLDAWTSLYVAGRLQKPVVWVASDAALSAAVTRNLRAALGAALLSFRPGHFFDERELFAAIANLSYGGDVRFALRAEDPRKVRNIVEGGLGRFRTLYGPHVQVAIAAGALVRGDFGLLVRDAAWCLAHVPETLRGAARAGRLSGALRSLVRFSSAAQTLKGALTAGPARAVGYARRKLLKGSGYPS